MVATSTVCEPATPETWRQPSTSTSVRLAPSWRRLSVAWPIPPAPRSIESATVPEEISAGI